MTWYMYSSRSITPPSSTCAYMCSPSSCSSLSEASESSIAITPSRMTSYLCGEVSYDPQDFEPLTLEDIILGSSKNTQDAKQPLQTIQQSIPLDQSNSPLFRLPAELRNVIYAYVFDDLVFEIFDRAPTAYLDCRRNQGHSRALLLVCRQIYIEARLFPFSSGTFRLEHPRYLRKWLIYITSEQRSAIGRLEFAPRGTFGIRMEDNSIQQPDTSMPYWWNNTDMALKMLLPGLRYIHVRVIIANWVDETVPKQWRWGNATMSKFAEAGRVLGEMREFVKSVNFGAVSIMELSSEADLYDTASNPYTQSRWDHQRHTFRYW
jgi:hypothetical protein